MFITYEFGDKHFANDINGGTYMNDAELFGYHVKRAIHMLTCAAAWNEKKSIIRYMRQVTR